MQNKTNNNEDILRGAAADMLHAGLDRMLEEHPWLMRELSRHILGEGDAVLFGGACRDFVFEPGKRPRDLDIVVSGVPRRCLLAFANAVPAKIENTSDSNISGLKITTPDLKIDIWDIRETWAFAENKVQEPATFRNLLLTTPLNAEAVCVDLATRIPIISKDFLLLMDDRKLRINLADNPDGERCAARLLDYVARGLFVLATDTARYALRYSPAAYASVCRYRRLPHTPSQVDQFLAYARSVVDFGESAPSPFWPDIHEHGGKDFTKLLSRRNGAPKDQQPSDLLTCRPDTREKEGARAIYISRGPGALRKVTPQALEFKDGAWVLKCLDKDGGETSEPLSGSAFWTEA